MADVATPQAETSMNFTAEWLKAFLYIYFQRRTVSVLVNLRLHCLASPSCWWTLLIPSGLSLLRLTYRALHQVQFASHGQLANYISWDDPSEFEPDVGALISLLLLSPLSRPCCYHTFCWQPRCLKVAHCSTAAEISCPKSLRSASFSKCLVWSRAVQVRTAVL